MWDWTEMLMVYVQLGAKSVGFPIRMDIEKCRRKDRRNAYRLL